MGKNFGERVKKRRKERGLTLEQLAKNIGSSKSYIWELENKPTIRPSSETVYKLARALGATVEELLDRRPADADDVVFFREYKSLSSETKKRLRIIMDALKEEDH